MPEAEARGPHLRTKFVFIDTQAFRKARLDWNGRSLAKLVEFAKKGQLVLLVTDITMREVKAQIQELLAEIHTSLSKHSGILQQLGASVALDRVSDQTAARKALDAAFDQFLEKTGAVKVPLVSDVRGVLDDYFGRRPPFSTKKKSEFPDALSIASLRLWCEQRHSTAYVVSEDPDLRDCCSEHGPLLHAGSIADIISQATVSEELHNALEKALRASSYLRDALTDKIKHLDVLFERSLYSRGRNIRMRGDIDHVPSVNVISAHILDQQENTFTCELEVEAEIAVNIDLEEEGGFGERGDEPTRYHSIHRTTFTYLYPEVIVRFDPSTGDLEFESIYVSSDALKVSFDDL